MDSVCSWLSRVLLFATPWNAPLSMEFARQEYWSGLPFPSSEVLSDLGIRLVSSALQADYLLSQPLRKPITTLGKAQSSEFFSQPRSHKAGNIFT